MQLKKSSLYSTERIWATGQGQASSVEIAFTADGAKIAGAKNASQTAAGF